MSSTVFNDYSKYYDLLYQNKDYEGEARYVHKLLQSVQADARTILNLGCGTGKHDAYFAKLGYQMTAVDMSQTMIDLAKERNAHPEKIQFELGDIRSYRKNEHFDAVFSLFHVMSYQTSDDDLRKSFQTVCTHLKENGVFIFDCWHGLGVVNDPPKHVQREVQDEYLCVKRNTVPVLHPERHVVDVNFEIEVHNKSTGVTSQFDEKHPMRYLFSEEIKALAQEFGLALLAEYAWMKDSAPDEDTWNAVYVLQLNPKTSYRNG